MNSTGAASQAEAPAHKRQRERLVQLAAAGERHRLSWWRRRGFLPRDLAPVTVAAAYTRATGRPPARDPERKQFCAYSAGELRLALLEVERHGRLQPPQAPAPVAAAPEPPPPAAPLHPAPAAAVKQLGSREGVFCLRWLPPGLVMDARQALWHEALLALPLPATRAFLSRNAGLRYLPTYGEPGTAILETYSQTLEIVRDQRPLIEQALGRVLGRPVAVAVLPLGVTL